MTDGKRDGGDGGIRTLDTLLGYAHLANECLQPLGHVSNTSNRDAESPSRRWRNRREQGPFVKVQIHPFQPSTNTALSPASWPVVRADRDKQARQSTVTGIRRVGVAARYSDLVIVGNTAYFSGYVPETALGLSVSEQTRDILEQIDQSLAEVGSDRSRILQATIWLADIASYDEMNAVWDAWIVPGQAPARACVEAGLADPGYGLEIQVSAAL